jgi:predicted component of type VI protein secretion system
MFSSTLGLTIIASHGQARTGGARAQFNAAGGTIGRDAANTLMLPDDGTVAEQHAAVVADKDGWQLVNRSAQARIAVNGGLLAPGEQTRLVAGDIVNIGAYVLQVSVASADKGPLHYRPPVDDYWDMSTPKAGEKTAPTDLDDLLGLPVDPLALFGGANRKGLGPAGRAAESMGLFGDMLATAPEAFNTPIDAQFDAQAGAPVEPDNAIRDNTPAYLSPMRVKMAAPVPETQETAQTAEMTKTPASHIATLRIMAPAPRPGGYGARPSMTMAASQPLPASSSHAVQLDALALAFLDGAGVAPDDAHAAGFTPAFMRTLGTLAGMLGKPR